MRDYELEKEYFEWLYDLVCNDGYVKELEYHELLFLLYQMEFIYILPRDKNRFDDGIELRYRFGDEFGIPKSRIRNILDRHPCSVLEMMTALAYRCENEIMCEDNHEDRTWIWFWKMMTNLNLGGMTDDKFDRAYVERIIERMLDRKYEANGRGGLFTIPNCKDDLRDIEIWAQMTRYLNLI